MRMLLSATVGLLGLVAISGAQPAAAAVVDQGVVAGLVSPVVHFGAPVTERLTVATDQSDARRRRRRVRR